MFKRIKFNNTLLVCAGALSFGLAFYLNRGWPIVLFFIIAVSYLLYIKISSSDENDYTFQEEVSPLFTQMGYEILKERPLNFLERMNREPEIEINPGPHYTRRYLRKYHRVFTVRTKEQEILDVLTEIKQHLDKEITVEILGTKVIENSIA